MTLEKLQKAKIEAKKHYDVDRVNALSGMIDAIQKASITSKGRVEITEALINDVLIKYQKTIQEQVDTCPVERDILRAKYCHELAIVKEFAPQLITDKEVIKNKIFTLICNANLTPNKKNKGAIMKLVSAELKGKADMKIVSSVVGEMLQ